MGASASDSLQPFQASPYLFAKIARKTYSSRPVFVSAAEFGGNMKKTVFAIFTMLFFLHPLSASAAESGLLSSARQEYSLLTGYGITHRGYGETRTEVQTYDLILRYGHFLSGELGKGHWYQGRHELLLELPLSIAVNHDCRSMFGATILGSWKFTGADQFTPYLFIGGGVLYVDLGLPTMGSRLNGAYMAGGGIQHFIRKDLAIIGEYRYHHISNMNTSSPNEPLNSSKFLIGLSFYR